MPRLIDLYSPWLEQYATEISLFDPTLYPEVPGRLPQVEGYLEATWAAIVTVGRKPEEWARSADSDRWRSLADLIARVEAEYCGRMLIGPADHARWGDDPQGLTWALLGVSDLDQLVRESADLSHLPRLFERGVRSFHLGPGLASERTQVLEVLAELASEGAGPRPLLDMAGLDSDMVATILAWFESEPARAGRLIPYRSRGALHDAAFPPDVRSRLRALGGMIVVSIGPPFYNDPETLRADLERVGPEGLSIGTGFPRQDQTLPGLETAEAIIRQFGAWFPAIAVEIIQGNAAGLLGRASGAVS